MAGRIRLEIYFNELYSREQQDIAGGGPMNK